MFGFLGQRLTELVDFLPRDFNKHCLDRLLFKLALVATQLLSAGLTIKLAFNYDCERRDLGLAFCQGISFGMPRDQRRIDPPCRCLELKTKARNV